MLHHTLMSDTHSLSFFVALVCYVLWSDVTGRLAGQHILQLFKYSFPEMQCSTVVLHDCEILNPLLSVSCFMMRRTTAATRGDHQSAMWLSDARPFKCEPLLFLSVSIMSFAVVCHLIVLLTIPSLSFHLSASLQARHLHRRLPRCHSESNQQQPLCGSWRWHWTASVPDPLCAVGFWTGSGCPQREEVCQSHQKAREAGTAGL